MQSQHVAGAIECLPPAYQQQHGWSSSSGEGCSSVAGFFFESRADLLANLADRRMPSRAASPAPQLLPPLAPATSLDYRYSVGADGEVVDMIRLKQAVPKPFERAVVAAAAPHVRGEKGAAQMGSKGGYLAQPQTEEAGSRGIEDDILFDGEEKSILGGIHTFARCLDLPFHTFNNFSGPSLASSVSGLFKLKAFLYCIGRDELFAPMWELDIVGQVWIRVDASERLALDGTRPV